MAATPKYKIFKPDGEYVASCKYAEDAGILVGAMGDNSTIRLSHKKSDIVWTQNVTGDAGESVDEVAKHIHKLEDERAAKFASRFH